MTAKKEELNLLLDHLYRHESGKLVSVLTRIFGAENLDLAEDVVQDSPFFVVFQINKEYKNYRVVMRRLCLRNSLKKAVHTTNIV